MINCSQLTIVFSFSCSLLFSTCVTAQLVPAPRSRSVPDRTLGRESSTVRRNLNIRGIPSDRIDGGARRGRNLFHSFQEFNVARGRGIYFSNPAGVENILTRVTGRNRSNILGRLGVLGGANLFLINPNGILFGKDASLDLRGSFYATTADGIKLGENGSFSASDPAGSNLLTVQPGALFQNAMRNYLATIENRANLAVKKGKSLTLEGDRVISTGDLIAPGGTIKLEALDGNVSVGKIYTADVAGGGDVAIKATGDLTFNGRINVSGGDLLTNNYDGNGGNVTLRANGNITFNPRSSIFSYGLLGGNITIDTAGDISVRGIISDNSFEAIDSVSFGKSGKGGDIKLTARSLSMSDSLVGNLTFGKTNSGNITINTYSLSLKAGAQIDASTRGAGNAGILTVRSQEILIEGSDAIGLPSGFFTSTQGAGNAGKLIINTSGLRLENGGQIGAVTFERGNAGTLIVKARDIFIKGVDPVNARVRSGLFTSVQANAAGNGGDLIINTSSLEVKDLGAIAAESLGEGKIGKIQITANTLNVTNEGLITIDSKTTSLPGGNISIDAGQINLDRGSISSEAENSRGANITIDLDDRLVLRSDSSISATSESVTGSGRGGDININAPLIVAFPSNNQIIANADRGRGGDITITANTILGYPQYLTITADSQRSIDGTITFKNLSTDLNSSLAPLPQNVINTENLVASSCFGRSRASKSTFIISGTGGLPQRPHSLYISDFPTGEVRSIPFSTDTLASSIDKKAAVVVKDKTENEPLIIRQARGWIKKSDGTIVLTTYPTEETSPSPSLNPSDCSTK